MHTASEELYRLSNAIYLQKTTRLASRLHEKVADIFKPADTPRSSEDEYLNLQKLEPYAYTRLSSQGHTRLIKIRQAMDRSTPLYFTLLEVSINDPPPYTAISYTWAGQKPTQAVVCDNKCLLITINAEDALRRLRSRRSNFGHGQYLWLDAICIDQSSIAEKSSQVSRMSDIYRGASNVAAWLGHIEPQEKEQWEKAHAILLSRRSRPPHRDIPKAPSYSIYVLTERDYWTRIWTIQEMTSNPSCKVYLGSYRPLPVANLGSVGGPERNRLEMHQNRHPFLGQGDAHDLIRTLLTHFTGEPLDYINGLQVVFSTILGSIEVDYTRPVVDAFVELAKVLLQHDGWHLLFVSRHKHKISGLPSWVPDWSSVRKMGWMTNGITDMPLSTKTFRQYKMQFSNRGFSLHLSGVRLAKIVLSSPEVILQNSICDKNTPSSCSSITATDFWDRFLHWIDLCSVTVPEKDWSFYLELSEVLLEPIGRGPDCGDSLRKLMTVIEGQPHLIHKQHRNTLLAQLDPPDPMFCEWFRHRHFILTDDGWIGAAVLASGVEPGDLLVNYDPSKHYFALRSVVTKGAPQYEHMGWVHIPTDLSAPDGQLPELFELV